MLLPRIRIRALLIAVAVVALEFWLFGETLLAALLVGPILGALLLAVPARSDRDDFDRPLWLFCGAVAESLAFVQPSADEPTRW